MTNRSVSSYPDAARGGDVAEPGGDGGGAGLTGLEWACELFRGEWAQFNVNFGVSSSGSMTTSVTESMPSKIAA